MKGILACGGVVVALGLIVASCAGAPTAPSNTCTYTYSAWSIFCINGVQTRTVLTSTPAGCTGTPVVQQACPVAPLK